MAVFTHKQQFCLSLTLRLRRYLRKNDMFLSAGQTNCKSVVVSTLVEQQQHFLISREIFIVSGAATQLSYASSSISLLCMCASGNQAALGVRGTLLLRARRGRHTLWLCRDGPARHRVRALRHTGARPAAHLTSPTLSTGGGMQIASPRFPRARFLRQPS